MVAVKASFKQGAALTERKIHRGEHGEHGEESPWGGSSLFLGLQAFVWVD
jgi:hypothetical protein